ncbi:hypothetical protein FACS189494_01460 [Spirochaetia bacterium]|nr:hypothetical protein FACS189494_01460 [Spirochaetia bacterium]
MKKFFCSFFLFASLVSLGFSQNFAAVPIESPIYEILDLASIRGLLSPRAGSKPWTQAQVLQAINEILGSEKTGIGKLNNVERAILEREKAKYAARKNGFDWRRGSFYAAAKIPKTEIKISTNIGLALDTEFSGGIGITNSNFDWGGTLLLKAYIQGDIGNNFSYNIRPSGMLIKAPRNVVGMQHTYYDGYLHDTPSDEFVDRVLPVYGEPPAYFPFTYRKKWDGSIFFFDQLDAAGFNSWPNKIAGAYALNSEIAASFIDNRLNFRIGRITHEWAAMAPGSSLSFNAGARPFLAIEGQFQPVSWFNISSLTGILEYFNNSGEIKGDAAPSQNAFSISMLEFNIGNFLHIDIGDTVIWPKRLDFGYANSTTSSFFYQNNIGDFDNLGIFVNIKGQIFDLMNLWFSFYDDEAALQSGMHLLDRSMIAYQGGTKINIPVLPFSFVKLSYTKIEPYTYTHNRNFVPWYNKDIGPMETSYMNNGVGLGHYLPPNSDELLLRFETMPFETTKFHFQYQMIRHGAAFGPSAVDGSSYQSELSPVGRDDNPILKKFFLQDGAYQWFHIVKAGIEYSFKTLPFKLFGEGGVVLSYFTNIDGAANQGFASKFHIVDEAPYLKDTKIVLTLGIKFYAE